MATIIDGITIGGTGGAIAGITVWLIQYAHDKITQKKDSNRVYNWLLKNTSTKTDDIRQESASTQSIASWNNLTEDRVRYICSFDKRIYQITNQGDEWSIYERGQRSVYGKRGLRRL